jgi:chromosome segregation ATPase
MKSSESAGHRAMEATLQRLESEINLMRNQTKDLPQEINELRNKNTDLESKMALFTATIHTLTDESKVAIKTLSDENKVAIKTLSDESKAKIHECLEEAQKVIKLDIKRFSSLSNTYVEEALRKEAIPAKVSSLVVEQLKTGEMQTVMQEYARKAVTVTGPEWIYEKLDHMVRDAFKELAEKIDKMGEKLIARVDVLGRGMSR